MQQEQAARGWRRKELELITGRHYSRTVQAAGPLNAHMRDQRQTKGRFRRSVACNTPHCTLPYSAPGTPWAFPPSASQASKPLVHTRPPAPARPGAALALGRRLAQQPGLQGGQPPRGPWVGRPPRAAALRPGARAAPGSLWTGAAPGLRSPRYMRVGACIWYTRRTHAPGATSQELQTAIQLDLRLEPQ